MKGDDVVDDDDDDAVRHKTEWRDTLLRNVPQDSVCSIALFTYHTGKNVGGGDMDGQQDTIGDLSWVSHLLAGPSCDKQGFQ
jgi:hypothetical protein